MKRHTNPSRDRGLSAALGAFALLALAPACFDFSVDLDKCRDGGRCASGTENDGGDSDGGATDGGLDAGPIDAGPFGAILCSAAKSCWENPWPLGQTLTAVGQVAPGDVWFGGPNGSVFHFLNGQWQAGFADLSIQDDPTRRPNALVPVPDGKGLYLGYEHLYEMVPDDIDGGLDKPTPALSSEILDGVWRDADGKSVMVGYHSLNDGAEMNGVVWSYALEGAVTRAVETPDASYAALLSYPDGGMLAVGWGRAARYGPGGWTVLDAGEEPPITVTSGWVGNDGVAWIAGGDQARCDDDGGWAPITEATQDSRVLVSGTGSTAWLATGTNVYSCDACGAQCVNRSPFGGDFSTDVDPHPIEQIRGFGDDVWIVGAYGYIAHADNSQPDPQFATIVRGSRAPLFSVYANGPGDAWAASNNGTVLHRDGEKGWVETTAPALNYRGIFRDPSSGVLLLVGDNTVVAHGASGEWTVPPITLPDGGPAGATELHLNAIHGDPSVGTFAVGDQGLVLKWNGDHFELLPPPTTENLLSVFATDGGTVWSAGAAATVVTWSNATAQWTTRDLSDTGTEFYNGIFATGPNDVYVAPQYHPWVKHVTPSKDDTITLPNTSMNIEALTGTPAGDVWLVGDQVAHLKSGGGIQVWNPQSGSYFHAVTMMNGKPLAVGEGGSIVVIDR